MTNNNSRTKNSIRNAGLGISTQILNMIFTFVGRTAFIYILGVEYLAISGLFANILVLLGMSELGLSTAMIFSMYEPLANKNYAKLAALIGFYKKINIFLACTIATLGLSLLPFLQYIVNLEAPVEHLEIYYLLYLTNTVFSYLMTHGPAIINADQKIYKLSINRSIFTLIQQISQIVILLITKNFILYLVIQLICTFSLNLFNTKLANKMYPFIKQKHFLEPADKKEIGKSIASLSIYRICGMLINNTDNILISTMIGTIWVGYYSNYLMITNSVTTMLDIASRSIISSIGNLHIESSTEHKYNILNKIHFAFWWLGAFCSVCFICLFQDFIIFWIGEQYLLSMSTVIVISLNYYLYCYLRACSTFRDAIGLFHKAKYIVVLNALLNLLLSIAFGYIWGLTGILLATFVSRLLSAYWMEPKLLINEIFKFPSKTFLLKGIKYHLVFISGTAITYIICSLMPSGSLFLLILKGIVCTVVSNSVFFVCYLRSPELKSYLTQITAFIQRKQT